MTKKTTTKKTTTKKTTTKKASSKTAAKKAPAKKTPRMSASAARAEGAAKTKRARKAKAVPQDHEVPSPKEIANDANLEAYAKSKAAKQSRSKKTASDRKPSGLDLAAKVLAEASEPLAAKAIAERAIAAGWTTSGKTPHATLYAAIIREISKKGDAARFKKTDRGLFVAADAKGGRWMYRPDQELRPERTESFRVDTDGSLVRSVVPRVGSPYEHRCTMWAFKRVCWRFDEHGEGDTVETLAAAAQIPVTQAATALAFLLERGIVTTERRRNFPATTDVHLDGMTEYHALREKGPSD